MQIANSFWREVLDYLPGIIMIFRIDDQEQAQLMFVNEAITPVLGYKPEEFILASESATHVQTHLEMMVDEIANNRGSSSGRLDASFFSKQGQQIEFEYAYRILRLKSSRNPFIAAELYPKGSIPVSSNASNENASIHEVDLIAASEFMQAIMQQLEKLVEQSNNIVFRGERSSGKTTLARKFLKMVSLNGVPVYEIDALEDSESVNAAIRELRSLRMEGSKAALLLLHVHELSKEQQEELLTVYKALEESGFTLRIVSTTNVALESLLEAGHIAASMYYALSFQQILVPPLRKRTDDLLYYIDNVLPGYLKAFGVTGVSVSEKDKERIRKHDWPGNWEEFLDSIRKSMSAIDENSVMKFIMADDEKADRQTSLFPESQKESKEKILSFDEMNKRYLEDVLTLTKDKIYGDDGAAALLGLKPTTLQSKLKKLGIR